MPDETPLDRIERKLDRVCTWIYGNGKVGAESRIDRLEQWSITEKQKTRWGTITGVAIVTAVVNIAFQALK